MTIGPNETAPPASEPASEGHEPGKRRTRDDRAWSVVWGAVLLLVGGYFFLRQTLGIDLPDIRWSQLWPVLLIVIGAVIVYRSMTRNRA
jgi:type VI protein secretion system component VasF